MTGRSQGRAAALAVGAALTLPGLLFDSAIAQDAPIEATAENLVYLEADEIFTDPETGDYIARGDVVVRYGTRTLRADEIVVDPDTDRVLASGDIVIEDDSGIVTFAEEAEFSEDLTSGVIEGMTARLPNRGKTGAAFAIRREGSVNELRRAFYTVCEPCTPEGDEKRPTWRLRARRVTQDESAQMLYYRDAVLEIKGVPVLYAPFFAHADPSSERRSGFLLPYFGESSRTGAFYEQPYYWAISSSQDMTLSPRFMTDANPLLAIEHRRKFFSGGSVVQASLTHEQEFDDTGLKFGEDMWRGHIFADAAFAVNETWNWGIAAERVSDDLYFRRYDIDDTDRQRGLYRRGSKRLLSQLFAEGYGDGFYASLAAMAFQGLRQNDDEDEFPLILPLGEYRRQLARDVLGGRLDGRLTTAVLQRMDGNDSWRASAEIDWRRRFIAPAGIVAEPFAFGRGDLYSVADYTTVYGDPVDETFGRTLGYVGMDVSWPFGRTAGAFDLIVEPVGSLVLAPVGGNDPRIPNNDSLVTELDESNLLDPNRVPGFDLWEDGSRAVLGARAIVRWDRVSEASLFVGQSFRTDDAIEFSPETGLSGDASDVVGAAEVALDPRRRLAARFRLDEEDLDFRRLDVDATYALGPASLSSKYLRLSDSFSATAPPREELSFTAGVEFTRNLGAYYSATQDLIHDETRYAFLGLVYNDECARLEIIYKRDGTRDRALNEGESVRVQFTLTSLGTFGARN